MSIAAIIEKYAHKSYEGTEYEVWGFLMHDNLPALTAELETLMREEACKFSEWANYQQFTLYDEVWCSTKVYFSGCSYTTNGLFDLYQQSKVTDIKNKLQ